MALYDMYKGCCSYHSAITETKTHWPFQQSRKLRILTSVLPPPFSPVLVHRLKEINLKSLICWLLTISCTSFSTDSSTAMETRRDRQL